MIDTPDFEADYKAVRALTCLIAAVPALFLIPAILTIAGWW